MPATASLVATSAGGICYYYSEFWCTVKDFQTLVSASIALVGVIGAIFGILVKAWLDEQNSRLARSQTAASMCALINAERRYFPETNLFRLAKEADINGLIGSSDRVALALGQYIDYFTKFVSGLSGFPSPISDRAVFMTWVSARLAFAISAIRAAPSEKRAELITIKSEEMRLLLGAAIATIDAINDELNLYRMVPKAYERHWRKERPEPDLGLKYKGRYYSTSSLQVRALRKMIEEGLRRMDADDALSRRL